MCSVHNSSCHRNCCTAIMINVKFAVTMLLCTQTWTTPGKKRSHGTWGVCSVHNCLCHRNCCTTIMINVKFAVTMLLCTQTWGLHCDNLFCTETFGGLAYLLLIRRRRTPACLVPVHICISGRDVQFNRSSLLYSSSGTFTASTVC